jgi:hypothetical protein
MMWRIILLATLGLTTVPRPSGATKPLPFPATIQLEPARQTCKPGDRIGLTVVIRAFGPVRRLTVDVRLPDAVRLVEGALTWTGDIEQGRVQQIPLAARVMLPGEHSIGVSAKAATGALGATAVVQAASGDGGATSVGGVADGEWAFSLVGGDRERLDRECATAEAGLPTVRLTASRLVVGVIPSPERWARYWRAPFNPARDAALPAADFSSRILVLVRPSDYQGCHRVTCRLSSREGAVARISVSSAPTCGDAVHKAAHTDWTVRSVRRDGVAVLEFMAGAERVRLDVGDPAADRPRRQRRGP